LRKTEKAEAAQVRQTTVGGTTAACLDVASRLAVVVALVGWSPIVHAKDVDTGMPGQGESSEEVEAPGEAAGPEEAEPATEAASPEAAEQKPGEWLPGKFSATVALTSNYIDRGISDTDNDPAIQGTLQYALETGLLGTSVYVSTFGSNVKMVADRSTAHLELDAFFGVRGEIGETGLKWDLGGAYYSYPGTSHRDNFNYWEIPLILTHDPLDLLEVQLSNWAAPEYQFNGGIGNYTNGLVTLTIPNSYVGLKTFGSVGYQYIEKAPSGTDWTLGTTVSIKGVDFTVAYTDTNYHARACGGNNQCDAKVVFTVGAQF
jgi:uncharacterized protein (TIGR02001 family)